MGAGGPGFLVAQAWRCGPGSGPAAVRGGTARVSGMVQSKASTVDEYLAQASAECRPALAHLRDAARRVLADHEERMQWGRPVYALENEVRFGFAEQKR